MLKYLLTQKDFLALESNDARDILSVEQIETALTYIQKTVYKPMEFQHACP